MFKGNEDVVTLVVLLIFFKIGIPFIVCNILSVVGVERVQPMVYLGSSGGGAKEGQA